MILLLQIIDKLAFKHDKIEGLEIQTAHNNDCCEIFLSLKVIILQLIKKLQITKRFISKMKGLINIKLISFNSLKWNRS